MSWINSLTAGVRNFLSAELNPNKVLDVKVEKYKDQIIHCREDSLILYRSPKGPENFELVLHRPYQETLYDAYSLCRFQDLQNAEIRFLQYKDKVPALVDISSDLNNVGQIQKLCDTIQENPTWNLAHLVTYFGLLECLSDPRVSVFINSEDMSNGISPLQLAVESCNVKAVTSLLLNNASLDHFDHVNNSVLHYAASTNKQIVSRTEDDNQVVRIHIYD